MIKSLKLTNFLSFGPSAQEIGLGNLNVLIGPNGSGKSNFLAAIDLLKNAPRDIAQPIRESGIREWLWKSKETPEGLLPVATINAVLETGFNPDILRYELSFGAISDDFSIMDEKISLEGDKIDAIYRYLDNVPNIQMGYDNVSLVGFPDPRKSIISQVRGPKYPEITSLGRFLEKLELHREWMFSYRASYRGFQRADLPTGQLEPYAVNLAHVFNRLLQEPDIERRFREHIDTLYEGVVDFGVDLRNGFVQIYFREENGFRIPATRLSDGTMRYLWLLAILCDPNPPPVICIEEPELGLHPDVIRSVADLLREASERCQIIVTTHSVNLVDAMTETPEAILVCEKDRGGTSIRRPERLDIWLDDYRLGDLWTSGELGGNRW